jgi:hypothetical protein
MNELEAKLDTKSQDITERTHNKVREVRQEYAEVRDKVGADRRRSDSPKESNDPDRSAAR